MIRNFQPDGFLQLRAIHQQGPGGGNPGFPGRPPAPDEWSQSKPVCCRLVTGENRCIIGRTVLSARPNSRSRPGMAEVSLHVDEKARVRGVGIMERPGRMPDGHWRDVPVMEWRSRIAGRP
jgi:hypothetical protein